jgi:hypothetical protein
MKQKIRILSWKLMFTALFFSVFGASSAYAQYCATTNSGGTGTFINQVNFGSNVNNSSTSNPTASPYYTLYSNLNWSVVANVPTNLSIQISPAGTYAAANGSAWIDWNNDNVFNATNEYYALTPTIAGVPSGTTTVPISITPPISAAGTTVRMRIRTRGNNNANGPGDACILFGSGETEDYSILIQSPSPCTSPVNAGTTISTSNTVCPSVGYTVSLSGADFGTGMTYQWESSADGVTYAAIPGATNPSYNTTQTVNTYYRCVLACSGGTSSTSTPLLVSTSSFLNCYCTSTATSIADEEIFNVSISTLNNSSTCSTTGGPGSVQSLYSDYTTTVPAPVLAATASYTLSVGIGSCGGNYSNWTKVWIDYNQNGLFTDPGEMVYSSPSVFTGPHTESATITIPSTALIGVTRMRVVNVETSVATGVNPCGTYTWGETEDYFVNIAPVPTCPQPTAFSVVTATTTTAQVAWTAGGSETQWQIEYGLAGFAIGTGTIVNVNAASPFTLTNLTPNSFYQAFIRGICSAGDTSYWAGSVAWNTYGLGQFMEADTECPTAGFTDISATGTLHTFTSTSQAVGFSLPFPLIYQGQIQNAISLTNSGVVTFNTVTFFSNFNQAITAATVNGLYAHWDAMQFAGMGVYSQTIGTAPNRKLIIQWNAALVFNSQDKVNVQLVIDEATQEIYFVYDDVNVGDPAFNNGASATIGVAGPNQDIQLSFNNANYLTNNSCAHFYYTDCARPTGLTYSYITPDEVAFTWTAGLANETAWTIIYGPAGFNPLTGGITLTATTASATLPNLNQNTQYDVYVYANCSATLTSAHLFGTFLTAPFCSNPGGMTNTTAVDTINAAWTWTAGFPGFDATAFNIMYGVTGFPLYSGTEVSVGNVLTNTIADANLLGGGVYQVYVQAICGTDTSQYVGPFAVTMPLSNDSVCGAELLQVDGTVYTFNNAGATVQAGETTIAPPATGAQTTTGWIASGLNLTTWFKFVAPASGNIRVNQTNVTYAGKSAVYASTGCSDFANFTLIAANDNAIGGSSVSPNYTVCGLTPGATYYFLNSGSSTIAGTYTIALLPIDLNAGSNAGIVDVCIGDTVDLFDGITGQDAGGVWTAQLASAGTGVNGNLFNSAGLAYQVFNFQYRLTEGCAYDSVIAQVKVFRPSSAGLDGTVNVCRNEPYDLLSGISGNFDAGGTWYNPSNQIVPNSLTTASNIPGQFNFVYITGNGICPDDTANVLVVVDPTCNHLNVEDVFFGAMNMIPNPTTGKVYISNQGSTEVFNYTVTDMEGRTIATQSAAINGSETTEIDLTGKVTGMYLIRVHNTSAEKVFRVVLQ